MSGKGSGRRPGAGYAEGWDAIFGKKAVAVAPNKPEDICKRNCPFPTPYGPAECYVCASKDEKED